MSDAIQEARVLYWMLKDLVEHCKAECTPLKYPSIWVSFATSVFVNDKLKKMDVPYFDDLPKNKIDVPLFSIFFSLCTLCEVKLIDSSRG